MIALLIIFLVRPIEEVISTICGGWGGVRLTKVLAIQHGLPLRLQLQFLPNKLLSLYFVLLAKLGNIGKSIRLISTVLDVLEIDNYFFIYT